MEKTQNTLEKHIKEINLNQEQINPLYVGAGFGVVATAGYGLYSLIEPQITEVLQNIFFEIYRHLPY